MGWRFIPVSHMRLWQSSGRQSAGHQADVLDKLCEVLEREAGHLIEAERAGKQAQGINLWRITLHFKEFRPRAFSRLIEWSLRCICDRHFIVFDPSGSVIGAGR